MNIGFDLDKVFIDYPPCIPDWFFDRFYKEKDNGVLLYRIPGVLEQKLRQLLHLPFLRAGITHNLKILQDIYNNHAHSLFLISSRFGFLKNQTNTLTKKYGFDKLFTSMHFNFNNQQPHIFKDSIIKKLHIDRYVDDDKSLITYLANHNPEKLFFWLNTKENKKIAKNIFAITHIEDILK